MTAPNPARSVNATPLLEVAAAFGTLGLVAFGGPMAHLGHFHAEFVTRRRWLDEHRYADLVALCQFLPGPASSQLAFALGMHRAGLPGAVAASLCFLFPSAAAMIALGSVVARLDTAIATPWMHGLKLAAIAVVAQAVWTMRRTLCPDRPRLGIAIIASALLLAAPAAWMQVAVIASGALAGWLCFRRTALPPALHEVGHPRGRAAAFGALALFGALLIAAPLAARFTDSLAVDTFDSFYRAGSLVFGGGHVVLPLLRSEVVPNGWLADSTFMAGYGATQAMPGPLFSFAGYLGAAMNSGHASWLAGLWCLLALFLPGWLLIGGMLPFWHRIRSLAWARASLLGANAAVVGVLFAALCSPLITQGIRSPADAAVAGVAFGLLVFARTPPLLIVVACVLAGAAFMR